MARSCGWWALLGAAIVGLPWAPSARGQPASLELAWEHGGIAAAITPSKVFRQEQAKAITTEGNSGTVEVAGVRVKIAAVAALGVTAVGMDADGDGKVGGAELREVAPGGTAAFDLTLPAKGKGERKCSVLLTDINVTAESGRVARVTAFCHANSCLKGTYENTPLRIIDQNLDGRVTQDGKDAILIGSSLAAMPLGKVHQVGKLHCQLKVAEDGSGLTVLPLADPAVGVVETPFSPDMLACLILTAPDGKVYDLKVSGAGGIPAGEYRMCYGMVARGDQQVLIRPAREPLTYPIKAGAVNLLRVGKPFRTEFVGSAVFVGGAASITVRPEVTVIGSGGEEYDVPLVTEAGRPVITIFEGDRALATESMGFG